MDKGDSVRFINNHGDVDDAICEVVEHKGDHLRIQKPTGEIIRIYADRVVPACGEKAEKEVSMLGDEEEFDPWDGLTDDKEVWVKHNSFSDTVICKTYAIIAQRDTEYKSINTYNGSAHKVMVYPMKNYRSIINKLQKRGYEQIHKD